METPNQFKLKNSNWQKSSISLDEMKAGHIISHVGG